MNNLCCFWEVAGLHMFFWRASGLWLVLDLSFLARTNPYFPVPIPILQPQSCHFSKLWSRRRSLPNSPQEDGALWAVHSFHLLQCYMTSALSHVTTNRTLHLMKRFLQWLTDGKTLQTCPACFNGLRCISESKRMRNCFRCRWGDGLELCLYWHMEQNPDGLTHSAARFLKKKFLLFSVLSVCTVWSRPCWSVVPPRAIYTMYVLVKGHCTLYKRGDIWKA